MTRARLIALGLILAALPCAYAVFVYGWQLVSFVGFAVRAGNDIPREAWGQIGLIGAQMAIIAAALFVVWQGAGQRRYRKAGLAMAVAWLATAPLLIVLLRPF